jgi:hypothetical protein
MTADLDERCDDRTCPICSDGPYVPAGVYRWRAGDQPATTTDQEQA